MGTWYNFYYSAEPCVLHSSGGGKRDRTDDLLHAMQALSQLSYTPVQEELCRETKTARRRLCKLAEWTGLEPATPGVTGRYSNQLNYHSLVARNFKKERKARFL